VLDASIAQMDRASVSGTENTGSIPVRRSNFYNFIFKGQGKI
tara:strand:+ start:517 stop:642 length:126 start_codon:yes stop_codon:yes gene_type:complete